MYTHIQLTLRYIKYWLTAANGKGHGVHSPFVFDFIKFALQDKRSFYCYAVIETLRDGLRESNLMIEVEDFGAGSAVLKSNRRVVKAMARSSLKPKKYAQLLFRMVNYYQPATILELGTSFGVTTAYLASGNHLARVYTCEGATAIANMAQQHFANLGLKNITLLQGSFERTLPPLLQALNNIDFAFIDGNHRQEPTLEYFERLLPKMSPRSIIVFDDIHWSPGMEAAWKTIQQHPAVLLTVDLFFIGIVFINPDFKIKQHFTVRF